jgi:hypothetical protein
MKQIGGLLIMFLSSIIFFEGLKYAFKTIGLLTSNTLIQEGILTEYILIFTFSGFVSYILYNWGRKLYKS